MEKIEKVFFSPGDVVTLKQDIANKPEMVVIKKEIYFLKKIMKIINLNL